MGLGLRLAVALKYSRTGSIFREMLRHVDGSSKKQIF